VSTRNFLAPYSTFTFPLRCEAALSSVSCGCAHAAPRSYTDKRKTSRGRPPPWVRLSHPKIMATALMVRNGAEISAGAGTHRFGDSRI